MRVLDIVSMSCLPFDTLLHSRSSFTVNVIRFTLTFRYLHTMSFLLQHRFAIYVKYEILLTIHQLR